MARGGGAIGWRAGFLAIIVVSALLGGIAGSGIASRRSHDVTTTIVHEVAPSPDAGLSIAELYSRVRPSVVEIRGISLAMHQSGVGSGLIIDEHGNIVTNYHVVSGYNQIQVWLSDGTSVPAQLISADVPNDLALIKIDVPAAKLLPIVMGDSDALRIGDVVVAIGNPFGLEGSLTQGVISGLGRALLVRNGQSFPDLIQTDAAINPGNSGGGLFNTRGEVIGITNALENPSGEDVFAGVGYAIPINALKHFIFESLLGGTVGP